MKREGIRFWLNVFPFVFLDLCYLLPARIIDDKSLFQTCSSCYSVPEKFFTDDAYSDGVIRKGIFLELQRKILVGGIAQHIGNLCVVISFLADHFLGGFDFQTAEVVDNAAACFFMKYFL